jgi:pSer/pThr/pTyr-binding forkhead associated (FHA) protein
MAHFLVHQNGMLVSSFELTDFETNIGRVLSLNNLVLNDTGVSRQHAKVTERDGRYTVIDLNSSNGVYVNDIKLTQALLKEGDTVRIGCFELKFCSVETSEEDSLQQLESAGMTVEHDISQFRKMKT